MAETTDDTMHPDIPNHRPAELALEIGDSLQAKQSGARLLALTETEAVFFGKAAEDARLAEMVPEWQGLLNPFAPAAEHILKGWIDTIARAQHEHPATDHHTLAPLLNQMHRLSRDTLTRLNKHFHAQREGARALVTKHSEFRLAHFATELDACTDAEHQLARSKTAAAEVKEAQTPNITDARATLARIDAEIATHLRARDPGALAGAEKAEYERLVERKLPPQKQLDDAKAAIAAAVAEKQQREAALNAAQKALSDAEQTFLRALDTQQEKMRKQVEELTEITLSKAKTDALTQAQTENTHHLAEALGGNTEDFIQFSAGHTFENVQANLQHYGILLQPTPNNPNHYTTGRFTVVKSATSVTINLQRMSRWWDSTSTVDKRHRAAVHLILATQNGKGANGAPFRIAASSEKKAVSMAKAIIQADPEAQFYSLTHPALRYHPAVVAFRKKCRTERNAQLKTPNEAIFSGDRTQDELFQAQLDAKRSARGLDCAENASPYGGNSQIPTLESYSVYREFFGTYRYNKHLGPTDSLKAQRPDVGDLYLSDSFGELARHIDRPGTDLRQLRSNMLKRISGTPHTFVDEKVFFATQLKTPGRGKNLDTVIMEKLERAALKTSPKDRNKHAALVAHAAVVDPELATGYLYNLMQGSEGSPYHPDPRPDLVQDVLARLPARTLIQLMYVKTHFKQADGSEAPMMSLPELIANSGTSRELIDTARALFDAVNTVWIPALAFDGRLTDEARTEQMALMKMQAAPNYCYLATDPAGHRTEWAIKSNVILYHLTKQTDDNSEFAAALFSELSHEDQLHFMQQWLSTPGSEKLAHHLCQKLGPAQLSRLYHSLKDTKTENNLHEKLFEHLSPTIQLEVLGEQLTAHRGAAVDADIDIDSLYPHLSRLSLPTLAAYFLQSTQAKLKAAIWAHLSMRSPGRRTSFDGMRSHVFSPLSKPLTWVVQASSAEDVLHYCEHLNASEHFSARSILRSIDPDKYPVKARIIMSGLQHAGHRNALSTLLVLRDPRWLNAAAKPEMSEREQAFLLSADFARYCETPTQFARFFAADTDGEVPFARHCQSQAAKRTALMQYIETMVQTHSDDNFEAYADQLQTLCDGTDFTAISPIFQCSSDNLNGLIYIIRTLLQADADIDSVYNHLISEDNYKVDADTDVTADQFAERSLDAVMMMAETCRSPQQHRNLVALLKQIKAAAEVDPITPNAKALFDEITASHNPALINLREQVDLELTLDASMNDKGVQFNQITADHAGIADLLDNARFSAENPTQAAASYECLLMRFAERTPDTMATDLGFDSSIDLSTALFDKLIALPTDLSADAQQARQAAHQRVLNPANPPLLFSVVAIQLKKIDLAKQAEQRLQLVLDAVIAAPDAAVTTEQADYDAAHRAREHHELELDTLVHDLSMQSVYDLLSADIAQITQTLSAFFPARDCQDKAIEVIALIINRRLPKAEKFEYLCRLDHTMQRAYLARLTDYMDDDAFVEALLQHPNIDPQIKANIIIRMADEVPPRGYSVAEKIAHYKKVHERAARQLLAVGGSSEDVPVSAAQQTALRMQVVNCIHDEDGFHFTYNEDFFAVLAASDSPLHPVVYAKCVDIEQVGAVVDTDTGERLFDNREATVQDLLPLFDVIANHPEANIVFTQLFDPLVSGRRFALTRATTEDELTADLRVDDCESLIDVHYKAKALTSLVACERMTVQAVFLAASTADLTADSISLDDPDYYFDLTGALLSLCRPQLVGATQTALPTVLSRFNDVLFKGDSDSATNFDDVSIKLANFLFASTQRYATQLGDHATPDAINAYLFYQALHISDGRLRSAVLENVKNLAIAEAVVSDVGFDATPYDACAPTPTPEKTARIQVMLDTALALLIDPNLSLAEKRLAAERIHNILQPTEQYANYLRLMNINSDDLIAQLTWQQRERIVEFDRQLNETGDPFPDSGQLWARLISTPLATDHAIKPICATAARVMAPNALTHADYQAGSRIFQHMPPSQLSEVLIRFAVHEESPTPTLYLSYEDVQILIATLSNSAETISEQALNQLIYWQHHYPKLPQEVGTPVQLVQVKELEDGVIWHRIGLIQDAKLRQKAIDHFFAQQHRASLNKQKPLEHSGQLEKMKGGFVKLADRGCNLRVEVCGPVFVRPTPFIGDGVEGSPASNAGFLFEVRCRANLASSLRHCDIKACVEFLSAQPRVELVDRILVDLFNPENYARHGFADRAAAQQFARDLIESTPRLRADCAAIILQRALGAPAEALAECLFQLQQDDNKHLKTICTYLGLTYPQLIEILKHPSLSAETKAIALTCFCADTRPEPAPTNSKQALANAFRQLDPSVSEPILAALARLPQDKTFPEPEFAEALIVNSDLPPEILAMFAAHVRDKEKPQTLFKLLIELEKFELVAEIEKPDTGEMVEHHVTPAMVTPFRQAIFVTHAGIPQFDEVFRDLLDTPIYFEYSTTAHKVALLNFAMQGNRYCPETINGITVISQFSSFLSPRPTTIRAKRYYKMLEHLAKAPPAWLIHSQALFAPAVFASPDTQHTPVMQLLRNPHVCAAPHFLHLLLKQLLKVKNPRAAAGADAIDIAGRARAHVKNYLLEQPTPPGGDKNNELRQKAIAAVMLDQLKAKAAQVIPRAARPADATPEMVIIDIYLEPDTGAENALFDAVRLNNLWALSENLSSTERQQLWDNLASQSSLPLYQALEGLETDIPPFNGVEPARALSRIHAGLVATLANRASKWPPVHKQALLKAFLFANGFVLDTGKLDTAAPQLDPDQLARLLNSQNIELTEILRVLDDDNLGRAIALTILDKDSNFDLDTRVACLEGLFAHPTLLNAGPLTWQTIDPIVLNAYLQKMSNDENKRHRFYGALNTLTQAQRKLLLAHIGTNGSRQANEAIFSLMTRPYHSGVTAKIDGRCDGPGRLDILLDCYRYLNMDERRINTETRQLSAYQTYLANGGFDSGSNPPPSRLSVLIKMANNRLPEIQRPHLNNVFAAPAGKGYAVFDYMASTADDVLDQTDLHYTAADRLALLLATLPYDADTFGPLFQSPNGATPGGPVFRYIFQTPFDASNGTLLKARRDLLRLAFRSENAKTHIVTALFNSIETHVPPHAADYDPTTWAACQRSVQLLPPALLAEILADAHYDAKHRLTLLHIYCVGNAQAELNLAPAAKPTVARHRALAFEQVKVALSKVLAASDAADSAVIPRVNANGRTKYLAKTKDRMRPQRAPTDLLNAGTDEQTDLLGNPTILHAADLQQVLIDPAFALDPPDLEALLAADDLDSLGGGDDFGENPGSPPTLAFTGVIGERTAPTHYYDADDLSGGPPVDYASPTARGDEPDYVPLAPARSADGPMDDNVDDDYVTVDGSDSDGDSDDVEQYVEAYLRGGTPAESDLTDDTPPPARSGRVVPPRAPTPGFFGSSPEVSGDEDDNPDGRATPGAGGRGINPRGSDAT